MKLFKEYVENKTRTGIGLFPGAFKPPHKGHFETVRQAAVENKELVILVSSADRDGISSTDSLTIWNIYKPYLPDNVNIYFAQSSPVTVVYQIVDILNNDVFTPTQRVQSPIPVAKEIANKSSKASSPYTINLYASEEDMKRYDAFFNPKSKGIYVGKKVKEVLKKDVTRLASATDARAALQKKNYEAFKAFLPDITKEDKLKIYNLLK